MTSVREKTEEFVELHGGNIVGSIEGQNGAISYKVLIEDRMFHIYFSRRWYYQPDGISIPKHALDVGIEENATIVVYVINECVWQYASEWYRLAEKAIKNSLSNTIEILILKEDLLTGSFVVNPPKPKGMDRFL